MGDDPADSGFEAIGENLNPQPTDENPATIVVRPYPKGPLWLIGVSLAVIAVCLVLRVGDSARPAFAQSVRQAGARGIFAFTGQLTKNSYGLFMVDVDAMTVWCYEWDGNDLQLVAGRSWTYDRYLEQLNAGRFLPDDVRVLVEQERDARLRARGNP